MKKIEVTSLSSKLRDLDIARDLLGSAETSLARAKSQYTHAIQVLESAMAQDPTVAECQNEVDELQGLYLEALGQTQDTAVCAWEGGFTEGNKEWAQDGWEVRLRTTFTPRVTDVEGFMVDIYTMRAYSVVRGVMLNKKAAVELNRTAAGGVKGLEVEEKTFCSVKRIENE